MTPLQFPTRKSPPSFDDLRARGPLLAAGAVLLAVFLFSSFHVVPPGHRGISVTLGKVDPDARAEGPTFKLPFIERVIDVPIRQQTIEGTAAAFSSDLQTVMITFKTLYRLPPEKIVTLFQQYAGDPYQSLVDPRIQEELKQITTKYRAEELVKSREAIKVEVLNNLRGAVGNIITITDLAITNFDFTDELEKAIEQKTIREQEALAKNFELEKARKDGEITLVQAEAEARAVKIRGEALKQSPEVVQLEIVKKWDGKSPTSLVTTQGGAGILLPVKSP